MFGYTIMNVAHEVIGINTVVRYGSYPFNKLFANFLL